MKFPKPTPRPKKARQPLRAKHWGTRRARPVPSKTAGFAFPRPTKPEKTKHGRRDRELGRMCFYAHLWCMLRDLSRGGNIQPHLMAEAENCGRGRFWGAIEVAHLGDRGATGTGGFRRSPDDKTAPLCRKHHRALDGQVGGRARWYAALSWEEQQELRAKLVRFARYYWDALSDDGRRRWEERALADLAEAKTRRRTMS